MSLKIVSIAALSAVVALGIAMTAVAEPAESSLPKGTKVSASFAVEGGKPLANLFDGDPKSSMIGQANTAAEGKAVWIDLVFAEPLADLAGVTLGESDPFHNYFPNDAEFWVDTDGNGTFDTKVGVAKLGPGRQTAGEHRFSGRVTKAHALRFLVTRQNVQGLRRSFQMSELALVRDAAAPVIQPTPELQAPGTAPAGKSKDAPAATAGKAQPALADSSIVANPDQLQGSILPLAEGTKITASFGTEKNAGPDKLFDNDLSTWMSPGGGSKQTPEQVSSITIRFPEPVSDLGGVELGETDAFKNYYPEVLEFWADSNGDGRCDTLLGSVQDLKPAKESVARHLFQSRLEKVHALEVRCVRQHVGGGKRAYGMNEMRLVRFDQLPLATPTPNSYRVLYFAQPVPEGSTIRASFNTEEGKGADKLLDRDPTTFMNGAQGSAKADVPASLFLRFPQPVGDLAGIKLGRSDPFQNYVWQRMEIWADTNGDGAFDTQAASFGGPGAGERRFAKPVAVAHGIELRVTQQKRGNLNRAFALSEIEGLIFRDDPGDQPMRYVVEDFEDFSSWRTWANNTNQPEGERYYGGYTFLAGAHRPELARSGQGVGIMRYTFKPGQPTYSMWATRGWVAAQEGIIDEIRFWANPQGYPCSISFELFDAAGKKFRTPAAEISGQGWSEHAVSLNSLPAMSTAKYPLVLKHIFLTSKQPGDGDVLLDDITLIGTFDRSRRVKIGPVYEGMAYAPELPLQPKYRVRNALATDVSTTLKATLYSSYDPKRERPIKTVEVPVKLPADGELITSIDLGATRQGHYELDLSVTTDRVAATHTDQLAVTTLNGKRVNRKPMYIGSQHPAGWIARVENDFVVQNVVVPLGMDVYRSGDPAEHKNLLETDLLFAAGFGGMPPKLRLPNQKNDDRGEPNDYDAYEAWVKERAEKAYAPYADRILSVEFYNEPDLPNFCFIPEIDTYLKMHERFRRAFRSVDPGIKIGTGGNTVQHGKEKKDFNPRMYTELAKEADVTIFHAHGALENYTTRHRMVEHWTELGGRPLDRQLIGQTEAGLPSGETAIGRLTQADNLVKKIGWAKAQPSSLYYCWFTTTDTYDPQGGYLGNENWGLVTYNQRLKASGHAMNEVIRKLANVQGLGEVRLDSRLLVCAYRREDGSMVYLGWPRERGATFLVRLEASDGATLSDMFGASQRLRADNGRISFSTNGYPFYLEVPAGAAIGPARAPDFVTFRDVVGVPPGTEMRIPVALKNTWNADARLSVVLQDPKETSIATAEASLPRGGSEEINLVYAMPADRKYGTIGCSVRIRGNAGEASIDETLPLTIVVAEKAPKAQSFKIDGVLDTIQGGSPIVLEKASDVQDLVADPSTPNWAGVDDLSARATLAHDTNGVYVCVVVRDQSHNPGDASDKLWQKDSIQLALYAGDAHTEIGLTESGGGFGWRWIAADAGQANKPLDTPLAVKREGDRTTYEMYLPFDQLGIARYEPMMPLRLTFLVNEDDGRGRVRLLKWFDGIAATKSIDRFGHLVVE